jgi:hypothetical protein
MKLIPIILSLILASSVSGYGIQASAQMAGSGGGTPCTASYPCAKICGNHMCAPGEVYTPGTTGSNANTTIASQKTNKTGTPSLTTQMNVSTNVTATKITNGTKNTNITTNNMTSTPVTPVVQSPRAQVAAGTLPANVKCISGYGLILNNFDSRPACVSQNTMSILESRGWGHAVS